MKLTIQLSGLLLLKQYAQLQAQTTIRTSFDGSEGYSVGCIHNVSGWKLTSGSSAVVADEELLYDGEKALRTWATASALQLEHIAFASNTTALGWGSVEYADMYLKLLSLPSVNITFSSINKLKAC